MDLPSPPSLNAALDRLWAQFLPQMEERVALLDAANQAVQSGEIPSQERIAANAAAHKLAGVLGTFGLTRGTVLAREAELIYAEDLAFDSERQARLLEIARELRSMIAARK